MGERLQRIMRELAQSGEIGTKQVCLAAAQVTFMSGAQLVVVSADRSQWLLCASDLVSRALADLEHNVGEGPCVDASRLGRPVLEPDLANPTAAGGWPAYAPAGAEAGARAVFGFPVRVGAANLGALGLYSAGPGALSDEQHADALVMADVAARVVLELQAGAPPGTVASTMLVKPNFGSVVHQASGMVSVQLGVDVADALVALRAHSYRSGHGLDEVAHAVVARTLRFDRLPDV